MFQQAVFRLIPLSIVAIFMFGMALEIESTFGNDYDGQLLNQINRQYGSQFGDQYDGGFRGPSGVQFGGQCLQKESRCDRDYDICCNGMCVRDGFSQGHCVLTWQTPRGQCRMDGERCFDERDELRCCSGQCDGHFCLGSGRRPF